MKAAHGQHVTCAFVQATEGGAAANMVVARRELSGQQNSAPHMEAGVVAWLRTARKVRSRGLDSAFATVANALKSKASRKRKGAPRKAPHQKATNKN